MENVVIFEQKLYINNCWTIELFSMSVYIKKNKIYLKILPDRKSVKAKIRSRTKNVLLFIEYIVISPVPTNKVKFSLTLKQQMRTSTITFLKIQ